MADWEETIARLKFLHDYIRSGHGVTVKGMRKAMLICEIAAHDAVELLEERKPVEPETLEEKEDECLYSRWYVCGACYHPIDYKDPYCRHCGRKVLWKDG